MPELPEVETVRRGLAKELPGEPITDVLVARPQSVALDADSPGERTEEFVARCRGQHWASFDRRGKCLLVELDSGDRLVIRLGMSGKLLLGDVSGPRPAHTHVVFTMRHGRELRFVDPRTFGGIRLYSEPQWHQQNPLSHLGLDALSREITEEWLWRRLRRTRRALKTFLMDQSELAGIGNIYAAEICFHAGIHPAKVCRRMRPDEVRRLHVAIRSVLCEAIECLGTTFSDFRAWDGGWGTFQDRLQVFQRTGQPCRRCRGTIRRMIQGGRSTFYCPRCQTR